MYFLGVVILLYFLLFIFYPDKIEKSLIISGKLLVQLVPIFLLIIFFMGVINYFVNFNQIKKYVGKKSGLKGWLIVMVAGILSHGPIYMWYPLLKDLQKKGVRNGLIATFLYNRAIKPALLPLMILYFGIIYVIILTIVMIIASIFQGIIIEKMVEAEK
ncbi:MAG: permease [Candidatus Marinimicrobia bacterium]|nr:permease [Candidatus Neomarinimicrobiota bacterium]